MENPSQQTLSLINLKLGTMDSKFEESSYSMEHQSGKHQSSNYHHISRVNIQVILHIHNHKHFGNCSSKSNKDGQDILDEYKQRDTSQGIFGRGMQFIREVYFTFEMSRTSIISGRSWRLFVISTMITQSDTVIRIDPPRKDAAPSNAYLLTYVGGNIYKFLFRKQ